MTKKSGGKTGEKFEKKATRDAYGEALAELGKKNRDIVVLDADLSSSTKTSVFAKAFPERFFNLGISEQDLVGTAAGLAAAGKIPFASTFALFGTGRAWEQARNDVGRGNLNVKLALSHAGITVGEDGSSHQCYEDIAVARVIPNFTIICPADAPEARKAVFAAAEHRGPVYIRLGREAVPVLGEREFRVGKAQTLREGSDVAIIATGIMVWEALQAAEALSKEGLSAEVVNVHTIKPFDEKTITEAARKTGAVVTAEEHSIIGGLGSAVAEALSEHHPTPLKRIGIRDVFGESGRARELMEKYGITAKEITGAAKEIVKRK